MLQAIMGSLFSIDFYRTALQEPCGKAIRYFLMLSLILGTIMGFKTIFWVTSGVNEVVETFNDSFPEFILEKGILQVEAKMPYTVFRLENEEIVLIDTSGSLGEEALAPYNGGLLFTKNALINKRSEGEFSRTEFKALQETKLTKADVAAFLPWLKWLSLIVFAAGLAYYFAAQILSALMVTALTLLISRVIKKPLPFQQALTLSLYALTLSCFIELARFWLGLNFSAYGVLYYGLPLVYAIQVLKYEVK